MRRSVTECGLCFAKIPEPDWRIFGISELPLPLLQTDLNPPRSKRLTFSSYLHSVIWKKRKKKKPNAISPPSLRPPSISCSHSFSRCLIRSLSGRPNRITSAARSTDSFLSTPALSGCSAGVFEILARCGGPARGRLPPPQRWVPGFFRRARHVRTWSKLQHPKLQLFPRSSCMSTSQFGRLQRCFCHRGLEWRQNAEVEKTCRLLAAWAAT